VQFRGENKGISLHVTSIERFFQGLLGAIKTV